MVSAAAVVALALGIGVNATVFMLVSAVRIIAPVLRGRALELLDNQGQVRSCINVEPNGEVVLRLLDRLPTGMTGFGQFRPCGVLL